MEPLFDVYLAAEVIGETDRDTVIKGLTALFKIDTNAAIKLMNGQRHRIKRGCDEATALRYRDAIAKVGVNVIIERQKSPSETADLSLSAGQAGGHGTAQKAYFGVSDSSATRTEEKSQSAPLQTIAGVASEGPATFRAYDTDGGQSEINTNVQQESDPNGLGIAPLGSPLSTPTNHQHEKTITVPEYDLAEPGATIPNLPRVVALKIPNTDHLSLQTMEANN